MSFTRKNSKVGQAVNVNGVSDSLFISESGNVGVGVESPLFSLDVSGAISTRQFFINSATISNNTTLPSGYNAMTLGPITIQDTSTITLEDNSLWYIF